MEKLPTEIVPNQKPPALGRILLDRTIANTRDIVKAFNSTPAANESEAYETRRAKPGLRQTLLDLRDFYRKHGELTATDETEIQKLLADIERMR